MAQGMFVCHGVQGAVDELTSSLQDEKRARVLLEQQLKQLQDQVRQWAAAVAHLACWVRSALGVCATAHAACKDRSPIFGTHSHIMWCQGTTLLFCQQVLVHACLLLLLTPQPHPYVPCVCCC
jgi:hypothetical protein